jgi:anhydro-N-acetylmuramic acid kinase
MLTTRNGLFLGLMSGTSVDGIDAALVAFDPVPRLVFARTYAMPADLAADVLRLSQAGALLSLDDVGALDTRLGQAFAHAANQLLEDGVVPRSQVRAIGSHGQTLRHRPSGDAPFTLQLADPNVIAERTGLTTVADFRRRDVAAGGQGAPLVPAFHAATMSDPTEERAILNLGGIANLTLLPAQGPVLGFDTGPGNGLMDAWTLLHRGQRFDLGGEFAAQGQVNPALLAKLCDEPWLRLAPPKSTGRDQFHLAWLAEKSQGLDLPAADVQATLVAFTARTVADALLASMPRCQRLLACGGGVRNRVLMAQLQRALPHIPVGSTADCGVDPDFLEAMAFAWLARETLEHRPGNLREVTGARGARVLGAIYAAS